MDTHSNILYVKENFPALSHLAHRTAATDKYRPETCCIIGNYYSLKAQHEKVSCSFLTTCGHFTAGFACLDLLHRAVLHYLKSCFAKPCYAGRAVTLLPSNLIWY